MSVDVSSYSGLLKDMYPLPGERIKQYVVDMRRNDLWERATCPRVDVEVHDDNCGSTCRNVGRTPWSHLAHDACATCNELMDELAVQPGIIAWALERARRPPIEQDRSKLSDEIEPDSPLMQSNPFFTITRGQKYRRITIGDHADYVAQTAVPAPDFRGLVRTIARQPQPTHMPINAAGYFAATRRHLHRVLELGSDYAHLAPFATLRAHLYRRLVAKDTHHGSA